GGDGQPTLNTEEMIAALNLLKELRRTGPPPPSTYADGVKLFREGRAAFAIDGDWASASYRQYTHTLDLGIARAPRISATGRSAALDLCRWRQTVPRGTRRLCHRRRLGHRIVPPIHRYARPWHCADAALRSDGARRRSAAQRHLPDVQR